MPRPEGATRRRLLPGSSPGRPLAHSTCGQVSRRSDSHAVCIFAHHFGPVPKPRKGVQRRARSQPVPLVFAGLCAQRKLQCVFNLFQRIGYATGAAAGAGAGAGAEATETVISCDAWAKPHFPSTSPFLSGPCRETSHSPHETHQASPVNHHCSCLVLLHVAPATLAGMGGGIETSL